MLPAYSRDVLGGHVIICAWILAVFGSSDADLPKWKQMALSTVVGLHMVSDRDAASLSELQADEDVATIAIVVKSHVCESHQHLPCSSHHENLPEHQYEWLSFLQH